MIIKEKSKKNIMLLILVCLPVLSYSGFYYLSILSRAILDVEHPQYSAIIVLSIMAFFITLLVTASYIIAFVTNSAQIIADEKGIRRISLGKTLFDANWEDIFDISVTTVTIKDQGGRRQIRQYNKVMMTLMPIDELERYSKIKRELSEMLSMRVLVFEETTEAMEFISRHYPKTIINTTTLDVGNN